MLRLIYVADPMCSWCWGFSPIVTAIAASCAAELSLELLMGGLRRGTTEPMTPGMAAMIREHWQHVESASGQPFDFGFFDREGFVYDTEPACRAVVTGRGLNPDLALPFLASIQGAFYRDGRDVTSSDVLAAIAAEEGYDRGSFMEAFAGDETREATATDFATAAGLGVRGFPTLIGHAGERHTALAVGYSPLAEVQRRVEGWLATADPLPSRTSSS